MSGLSEQEWKRRFASALCVRLIDNGLGIYEALEDAGAQVDNRYIQRSAPTPEAEVELVFSNLPKA